LSGSYNTLLGFRAGDSLTSGDANVLIGTSAEAASATGDRQLTIGTYDGTTTTTWITGDSSGNLTFAATVSAATAFVPDAQDGAALGTSSLQFSDLFLADGGVLSFGDDNEITLTHTADDGLVLKHVGTGDGKEPSLTFQAGDNDIAVDDVLGSIFFQAPDEGAGTDAILVAAGIEAVSEGNFSASNNATKLSFKTAASEAATEKMALSSTGVLTVNGAANVPQQAITSSSNAVAWDASAKPNAYHLTTENTTISAPTNAVEGAFICLELNHDGTTTVAWNAIFNFAADTAPTTTDTNAKTDILVFRYNGAIWQEVGRTLNIPDSI